MSTDATPGNAKPSDATFGNATPGERSGGDAVTEAPWCDRCGKALAEGPHLSCAAARELEPPRFCRQCRRRMKVQVLPAGWRATCSVHGDSAAFVIQANM